MKKLILTLILFSYCFSKAEEKVLFIGNSISESWLEMRLKELADSAGKDLFIQTLSFGGYTLNDHVKSETTHQWIDSLDWDFVVLQENPGILASDSATCDQNMFNSVDSLYKLIKNNNPCTEVVFFMPWGFSDNDTGDYPGENYYKQQNQMSENTLRYSNMFYGITSPVGALWKEVRTKKPWLQLYRDGAHASHIGHLLSASVFYTLFFNESPALIKNSAFVSEFIGDSTADYLKLHAGYIVLGDVSRWNLFVNVPVADFSFSTSVYDLKAEFYSRKSSPFLNHRWFLGDGDSSNEITPVHIYPSEGEYKITHIVESNCYPPDTAIQIINLTLGIEDEYNDDDIIIYPNPNVGMFNIKFSKNIPDEIRIFDLLGREVCQNLNNKSYNLIIQIDGLPSGIYLLRINQKNNYKLIIAD